MEHDNIIGADGIAVHLDGICAVFLFVSFADSVGGQFAGLAGGDKACAELKGENRAADKATRFDTYDLGDTLVTVELREVPSDDVKCTRILECGSEVFEHDTLGGEIDNVADF